MRLDEATSRLARLGEVAVRGGEVVVIARLKSVDDELPDVMAQSEGLPLVVLIPDADNVALEALRAGAGAVIGTEASGQRIAAAVMSVSQGLVAIPAGAGPFLERRLALSAPPEPLTPREIEILGLLAGGDSNKTIAARLSISVHTVKFHISSILSKLDVSSRTEAVALGLRLGIVLL